MHSDENTPLILELEAQCMTSNADVFCIQRWYGTVPRYLGPGRTLVR